MTSLMIPVRSCNKNMGNTESVEEGLWYLTGEDVRLIEHYFDNSLVDKSSSRVFIDFSKKGSLSHPEFCNFFNKSSPKPPVNHSITSDFNWTERILSITQSIHLPLILLTNTLVLATFCVLPQLRTPDNYIIASLASVDLATGIVTIPFEIAWIWDNAGITSSHEMCMVSIFFKTIFYALSFNYLVVMVFDRFLAVSYPFWYIQYMSNAKMGMILVGTTMLNTILRMIMLIPGIMEYHKTESISSCRCGFLLINSNYRTMLYLIKAYTEVFICFVLCLYVSILANMKAKEIRKIAKEMYSDDDLQKNISSFKISSLLIFVYLILWTPSFLIQFLKTRISTRNLLNFVQVAIHCRLLNAWVNGLVYAYSRKIYKDSFIFLLSNSPRKWGDLRSVFRRQTFLTSFGESKTVTATKVRISRSFSQLRLENDKRKVSAVRFVPPVTTSKSDITTFESTKPSPDSISQSATMSTFKAKVSLPLSLPSIKRVSV